jgi:hypothetical protein
MLEDDEKLTYWETTRCFFLYAIGHVLIVFITTFIVLLVPYPEPEHGLSVNNLTFALIYSTFFEYNAIRLQTQWVDKICSVKIQDAEWKVYIPVHITFIVCMKIFHFTQMVFNVFPVPLLWPIAGATIWFVVDVLVYILYKRQIQKDSELAQFKRDYKRAVKFLFVVGCFFLLSVVYLTTKVCQVYDLKNCTSLLLYIFGLICLT